MCAVASLLRLIVIYIKCNSLCNKLQFAGNLLHGERGGHFCKIYQVRKSVKYTELLAKTDRTRQQPLKCYRFTSIWLSKTVQDTILLPFMETRSVVKSLIENRDLWTRASTFGCNLRNGWYLCGNRHLNIHIYRGYIHHVMQWRQ